MQAPAYVIHLPRHKERLQHWQPLLDSGHAKLSPAVVDANTLDLRTDTRVNAVLRRRVLDGTRHWEDNEISSRGPIACALSHGATVEAAFRENPGARYVVVFEDDVQLAGLLGSLDAARKYLAEDIPRMVAALESRGIAWTALHLMPADAQYYDYVAEAAARGERKGANKNKAGAKTKAGTNATRTTEAEREAASVKAAGMKRLKHFIFTNAVVYNRKGGRELMQRASRSVVFHVDWCLAAEAYLGTARIFTPAQPKTTRGSFGMQNSPCSTLGHRVPMKYVYQSVVTILLVLLSLLLIASVAFFALQATARRDLHACRAAAYDAVEVTSEV